MNIDEFKVKVKNIEYNVVPIKVGTKTQFSTDINGANHTLQAKYTLELMRDLRHICVVDVEKELTNILKSEISVEITKLI